MWPLLCPGGQASGILGPRNRGNQPQVNNSSSREKEGTGKIENKIKIGSLVMLERLEVSPNAQGIFRKGTG